MKITYLSAAWCGPCKQFGPVVAQFCADNGIEFVKLDIENATDLVAKFGVKSIPFLIFDKDGVEAAKAGVMSVSELRGFYNL